MIRTQAQSHAVTTALECYYSHVHSLSSYQKGAGRAQTGRLPLVLKPPKGLIGLVIGKICLHGIKSH